MKSKIAVAVFALCTLLLLTFIWGQSALPRSASLQESSALTSLLKPLLDPHNRIPYAVFHRGVRKAAHFTEFAALGFCVTGLLSARCRSGKLPPTVLSLLFCLLVAAADETIQVFSEGRGAMLRDVLLDFSGALCGFAVMLLLQQMIRKKQI